MTSTVKSRTSGTEDLQCIFHSYREATGLDEVELDSVFEWAMRKGLWVPTRHSLRREFKREMSKALCEERILDPQGRVVRRNHAVRTMNSDGQYVFKWAEVRTAPAEYIRESLQQRREKLVAMAIRHKRDVDSYNDNNVHGVQLMFEYNFEIDIEESEMPSEYLDPAAHE